MCGRIPFSFTQLGTPSSASHNRCDAAVSSENIFHDYPGFRVDKSANLDIMRHGVGNTPETSALCLGNHIVVTTLSHFVKVIRSGAPHEVGRREREGLLEMSKKGEVPGDPVKKEAREGFENKWAMIHLHVVSSPFKLLQVCYYVSCNSNVRHGFTNKIVGYLNSMWVMGNRSARQKEPEGYLFREVTKETKRK